MDCLLRKDEGRPKRKPKVEESGLNVVYYESRKIRLMNEKKVGVMRD